MNYSNLDIDAFDDFRQAIGLSADVPVSHAGSPQVDYTLRRLQQDPSRNYVVGLFLAFILVAEELLDQVGNESLPHVIEQYPPEDRTTLSIRGPKRRISARSLYNRVADYIIGVMRRSSYPNSPGHALSHWRDYSDVYESIAAMSPQDRALLTHELWKLVASLPVLLPRSNEALTPRPFQILLEEFESQSGDPPGAVLQGLAFAYYRADAPNVTLETGRAKAGSARTGRIGDIDGWSGDQLVLCIEVKDKAIRLKDVESMAPFFGNVAPWPDATVIVVARSFSEDASESLLAYGARVLDRPTMLRNVSLWDLRKQDLATREFAYFLFRVQQHPALTERLRTFLTDHRLLIS